MAVEKIIQAVAQAIAKELHKIWHTLRLNVEDDMDDFADKLFEKNIISRGVRKSNDFNKMMNAFVSTMDTFKTIEKCKEHCSTLLTILDDIEGGARRTSRSLKESWETAVRCIIKIDFSL